MHASPELDPEHRFSRREEFTEIDELNERASNEIYHDPKVALHLSNEAEQLAGTAGYAFGLARSRYIQALLYSQTASSEIAQDKALQALYTFRALRLSLHLARVSKLMGDICYRTGNLDEAIEYFEESLVNATEAGDELVTASILVSMGNVHNDLAHTEEARDVYIRALNILKATNYPRGLAVCLNDLASLYWRSGDYENAQKYCREALELAEEIIFDYIQVYSLNILGDIKRREKKYAQALRYHQRGLELSRHSGDRRAEAESIMYMARLHDVRDKFSEAVKHYEEAIVLAIDIDAPGLLSELYELASDCYHKSGDTDRALEYYRKMHELYTKMMNDRVQKSSKLMRMRQRSEQAIQEAEIHRLKNVELADALARLEEANTHLKQLNAEKSEFMRIAAHDLKNPLTGMIFATRNSLRDFEALSNDALYGYMQGVAAKADRMVTMIRNLLTVNEMEMKGIRLAMEEFDMCETVRDVAANFSAPAQAKGINIVVDAPPDTLAVCGDKDALTRVVENLVSNAVKYSTPGREVKISLADSGKRLCIEVRNEGQGIAAHERQKLFRKFERLSARPTGDETATGLGLAIVRMLVDAMGGIVTCESEPSRATSFIVEIPTRTAL